MLTGQRNFGVPLHTSYNIVFYAFTVHTIDSSWIWSSVLLQGVTVRTRTRSGVEVGLGMSGVCLVDVCNGLYSDIGSLSLHSSSTEKRLVKQGTPFTADFLENLVAAQLELDPLVVP